MNGKVLFQWVLAGPDKAECVAVLSDSWLCVLCGYLRQDYDANDLTGEVLGICLVEQARRFEAAEWKRKDGEG